VYLGLWGGSLVVEWAIQRVRLGRKAAMITKELPESGDGRGVGVLVMMHFMRTWLTIVTRREGEDMVIDWPLLHFAVGYLVRCDDDVMTTARLGVLFNLSIQGSQRLYM
jgi:hypothetical protein